MLSQVALLGLMLVLVAACGWMLLKVYGPRTVAPPVRKGPATVGSPGQFPDAITELIEDQLGKVPDAAIRFALQSRVEIATPMGATGRSLALLEVFFDLERLETDPLKPEAFAQMDEGSHPAVGLLRQRPAVREAMLAKQIVDQLGLRLTWVVGTERTKVDFQHAGPLPAEDQQWVRWYSDGRAREWFKRLAEQAELGIGSGSVVGLIEAAAREIGQTVPLVCFPNLLEIVPAECLTLEKSYAAGRAALWNDFLQTRRSLRASEDALKQLNDELEQRVRLRTAQLEASRARAEDSERAKDRFLASMSHEIRTPLHGVLGMLDLLRLSGLTTAQAEQAAVMQRSGAALLDIVNDILDFSKMQTGVLPLESTEYSPRDIAADTISLFQPRAQSKNLALQLVVEGVPQHIMGDPARMRQVLGNLVGNAVKFTERGSITLSLSGDEDRGRLSVGVADSGIGIPESELQRVFDPFSQADESTHRRYGGTGLGLAISSELVRAMGGQLAVDSHLGVGSTFYFEIPMKAVKLGAPARAEPAPDHAAYPAFLADVLLAEDNPVNKLLAQAQLATLGCRVQVASSGGEAVRLYSEHVYDIVLMDCHMPEVDGYQATTAIRALERERGTRRVPIIAVTATVLESERELCEAVGMDDFLSKPYSVHQLAAMLGRWLPTPESAEATAALPPPTASVAAPLSTEEAAAAAIDMRVFRDLRQLQRDGNPDLIQRVVLTFRKDAPLRVGELRAAIRAADAAGVHRAAHTLRSASASVGAVNLSTLCGELEARAREGSLEGAGTAANTIDRVLSEAITGLDRLIRTAETSSAVPTFSPSPPT